MTEHIWHCRDTYNIYTTLGPKDLVIATEEGDFIIEGPESWEYVGVFT